MTLQFFPPHIQREIEATTMAVDHLQKRWPDEVVLSGDGGTSIYDYYPYLFLNAFPSLTPSDIQPLALAGRLFANSLFLCDEVMDRTLTADRATINALRIQAMQLEAYQLLHQLFPPEATFWKRFRTYMAEYASACIQEQHFASGNRPWREYTEALAFQIAIGKTGISRAVIAGLTEMVSDDRLHGRLTESINHYYIARQMWDDLCDWKEDLPCGIPSLLLSRVVHERPPDENQERLKRWMDRLAREIYYGGHAHYVMEVAIKSLDRADGLTADIPNLHWRHVINKFRGQCQALSKDIRRIVGDNFQRVGMQLQFDLVLPSAQSRWQQVAWAGLRFIIRQWQLGFGEMRHIMRFPRENGFTATQEYQYGDVFQRALIADVLCDANELLNGQLQPVIDYETSYLKSRRSTSDLGGWSYFPDLPELPPDADDLAQIMQVLLRSGHRAETEKYCETPLSVLLNDNAYADGSFETWIVPANERTPEQERQAEFVKTAWGAGPDNDVIANLLYALTRYDPKRFAQNIRLGVNYLEAQQEADGSWSSTWYHGPYYGTYVCLRLLTIVQPDSSAISRALHFLRSQQRHDGGWGLADQSDPLSTAFALLGLAVAQTGNLDTGDGNRVTQAHVYFQQRHETGKGWSNCRFIQMELGRATGNVQQVLSYGSRTVTSAFVLKAALAWHRLLANIPEK